MTTTRTHHTTPAADIHDLMARQFPLLPRAKPVCRPLTVRVARVRELARQADQRNGESLVRAGETFNLAALIASDCGLPDLARTWCWQQVEVFSTSRAYDAPTAKLALQPLINLGRLLIRDGNGIAAYDLLSTLFESVKSQSDTILDGARVTFADFVRPGDDHHEVVRWLWSVLLADGTKALTRAGKWPQALQHVHQHKGVGQRLLDGRQVAILTHAAAGDHATALTMLSDTRTSTPWETAVAACMTVLCLRLTGQQTDLASSTMLGRYLDLELAHEDTVFGTRLGLCVLDLADRTTDAPKITQTIARNALKSADAYAAHDAVTHPLCQAKMHAHDLQALTRTVIASGLRRGTIPTDALNDLMKAVKISQASMEDAVSVRPRTVRA